MTNSRAKGARGEREACDALERVTTLAWERTAQRWGNATADVWAPRAPALGLHLEVKVHARGLKRATAAAIHSALCMTRDDLLFARLDRWREVVGARRIPALVNVLNGVSGFMRQAASDAEQGELPVVLMRTSHSPWVVVWRARDDGELRDRLLAHWRSP